MMTCVVAKGKQLVKVLGKLQAPQSAFWKPASQPDGINCLTGWRAD